MGVRSVFDAVILSVEAGWRKPHPGIYTAGGDACCAGGVNAVDVTLAYPEFYARWSIQHTGVCTTGHRA